MARGLSRARGRAADRARLLPGRARPHRAASRCARRSAPRSKRASRRPSRREAYAFGLTRAKGDPMLGRRAAVAGSAVVLAVGGGTALAAAHGNSPSEAAVAQLVARAAAEGALAPAHAARTGRAPLHVSRAPSRPRTSRCSRCQAPKCLAPGRARVQSSWFARITFSGSTCALIRFRRWYAASPWNEPGLAAALGEVRVRVLRRPRLERAKSRSERAVHRRGSLRRRRDADREHQVLVRRSARAHRARRFGRATAPPRWRTSAERSGAPTVVRDERVDRVVVERRQHRAVADARSRALRDPCAAARAPASASSGPCP